VLPVRNFLAVYCKTHRQTVNIASKRVELRRAQVARLAVVGAQRIKKPRIDLNKALNDWKEQLQKVAKHP